MDAFARVGDERLPAPADPVDQHPCEEEGEDDYACERGDDFDDANACGVVVVAAASCSCLHVRVSFVGTKKAPHA